jgi:hypothetical protein
MSTGSPPPIVVERTPNPNAMKFTLDGSYFDRRESYQSEEEATESALAKRLFQISGVQGVFCLNDFISVNKNSDASWDDIIPKVKHSIEEFFSSA